MMAKLEVNMVGHVAGWQSHHQHRLKQSPRERFAVKLFDEGGRIEEVFGDRQLSASKVCEIRTIAQWLGTPVGSRFVEESLKRRGFIASWRKRTLPVGSRPMACALRTLDYMMDVEWIRSCQRGTPAPATKEQHELALQIMRWLNTAPGKSWARAMLEYPQFEEEGGHD